MNKIHLRHNDAFRPKVEKISELSTSFLAETYRKVFKKIFEITANDFSNYNGWNNIIAITGDRGAGKSSALESISNALKSPLADEKKAPAELKELSKSSANPILVLPTVDPTLFHGEESIVEVLVALMFKTFQERFQDKPNLEANKDDIRGLYAYFEGVYNSLKVIERGKKDLYAKEWSQNKTTFQTLQSMAMGPGLRVAMEDLISKYLKIMKGAFLVLTLDDLDLQLNSPMGHLESIRKFLSVKGLVILMGIRIEQLQANVEQHFFMHYKELIRRDRLFEDPREMAHKYLEKLVPKDRRVSLPDFAKEIDQQMAVTYEGVGTGTYEYNSLKEAIVSFTFDKVGILIVPQLYSRHPLFPSSLRELHDYFAFLDSLPDFHDKKTSLEQRSINLEEFEDFLISKWAISALSTQFRDFINNWLITPTAEKNKFAVTTIIPLVYRHLGKNAPSKSYLPSWPMEGHAIADFLHSLKSQEPGVLVLDGKLITSLEKERGQLIQDFDLLEICRPENNFSNISIGDVLILLRLISTNFAYDREIQGLSFLLKILYSLRFGTYDLKRRMKRLDIGEQSTRVLKDKEMEDAKLLAGGFVYEPETLSLIRPARNYQDRYRSHFLFDYRKVKKYAEDNNLLRGWAFFNLFLLHGRYFKDFRKKEKCILDVPDNNTTYAFFNLLTLPAKLLDWHTQLYAIGAPQKVIDIFTEWQTHNSYFWPLESLEFLEDQLYSFKRNHSLFKQAFEQDFDYIHSVIFRFRKAILTSEIGVRENFSGELPSNFKLFDEFKEELAEIYNAAYQKFSFGDSRDEGLSKLEDPTLTERIRLPAGLLAEIKPIIDKFRWYTQHRIHFEPLKLDRSSLIKTLRKFDFSGKEITIGLLEELWVKYGQNDTWHKNQFVEGVIEIWESLTEKDA